VAVSWYFRGKERCRKENNNLHCVLSQAAQDRGHESHRTQYVQVEILDTLSLEVSTDAGDDFPNAVSWLQRPSMGGL
jgi:hypothetical protein